MKLKPVLDVVHVRRIDAPKVSEGGIHLPENLEPKVTTSRGRVISAGPGRWSDKGERIPCGVKAGDVVFIPPVFSGVEKKKTWNSALASGELLIRAGDLVAVEEEG